MNYGVKYSIVQTVVPAAEPVSAAEAKTHMNVTLSTDDTLIGTYITAARKYVENVLGRQLITATYRLSLDSCPPEILLPYPPLGAVTSIVYIDTAGTAQTLAAANYQTNSDFEPCRIKPVLGKCMACDSIRRLQVDGLRLAVAVLGPFIVSWTGLLVLLTEPLHDENA